MNFDSFGQPQGGYGNFGNMPQSQRPQAFSTSATDWTGRRMQPDELFGQRDAFIQQINEAQGRQSAMSGNSFAAPQQLDFRGMTNTARDMQRSGWQNPFSEQGVDEWQQGYRMVPPHQQIFGNQDDSGNSVRMLINNQRQAPMVRQRRRVNGRAIGR